MALIFVVDDEERTARFVRTVLENGGHKVEEFHNGAKLLERLGVKEPKEPKIDRPLPDLILLDLMMPEIHGHEVASLIENNPETRSIPIVILTGKGQPNATVKFPSNVKVYLEKPFNPQHLLETVADLTETP